MEGLDVPLPNPLYKKQLTPEEDMWETDSVLNASHIFNHHRPDASGSGISNFGIRGNRSVRGEPQESWVQQAPSAIVHDAQDDGWDNDEWGKQTVIEDRQPSQSNVDFTWSEATDGCPPPAASVLSYVSPPFSNISTSQGYKSQFYGSEDHKGKQRIAHVNKNIDADDWDDDKKRSPSPVNRQEVSNPNGKLKTAKSGIRFPLLKDDESVELVRVELAGIQLTPREWTVSDVKEFILANGYGVQAMDLAKANVDGEQMMACGREKLGTIRGFQCNQALTVSKLFHRLRTLCKSPYVHSAPTSYGGGGSGVDWEQEEPRRGGSFHRVGGETDGTRGRGRGRGRGRSFGVREGRGFGHGRGIGRSDCWNSSDWSAKGNDDLGAPVRAVNLSDQKTGSTAVMPEDESWEVESISNAEKSLIPSTSLNCDEDEWGSSSKRKPESSSTANEDEWDADQPKASKLPRIDEPGKVAAPVDDNDEWN